MNPIKVDLVMRLVKSYEKAGQWFVEGYATTHDIDLEGDIVSDEAMKISEHDLLKNSTMLFNHDVNKEIGAVKECKFTPQGLWIKALISKTVPDRWQEVKEGVLNKFSIRALILRAKKVFLPKLGRVARVVQRMLLLECSLCSLPVNTRARTLQWYISKSLTKYEKKGGEIPMAKKDEGRVDELVDQVIARLTETAYGDEDVTSKGQGSGEDKEEEDADEESQDEESEDKSSKGAEASDEEDDEEDDSSEKDEDEEDSEDPEGTKKAKKKKPKYPKPKYPGTEGEEYEEDEEGKEKKPKKKKAKSSSKPFDEEALAKARYALRKVITRVVKEMLDADLQRVFKGINANKAVLDAVQTDVSKALASDSFTKLATRIEALEEAAGIKKSIDGQDESESDDKPQDFWGSAIPMI